MFLKSTPDGERQMPDSTAMQNIFTQPGVERLLDANVLRIQRVR